MRKETDPDIPWVAHLAAASPARAAKAVDEAAAEGRLFAHLAREHRAGGREHYVEIDAPLELFGLVRLLQPRHVVEVGVSSGVSSAYLLQALERNGTGTLHSVDLPKYDRRPARLRASTNGSWSLPAGRGPGWAVPWGLRKRWDLRLGDKAVVLPLLGEELSRIDLFVYDVPHDDRRSGTEFRALDPCMPRGAVAIVDHGPGGGPCPALRGWATRRNARITGRSGLGLYGFRCG
jgi:Methyltransferase domain